MRLGILISCDKHLDHIIGFVTAAVQEDVRVTMFCMDTGVLLLLQKKFRDLCKLDGVIIGLCRHSAEKLGIDVRNLAKDIVCGSQFNNAIMVHESEKVIVL